MSLKLSFSSSRSVGVAFALGCLLAAPVQAQDQPAELVLDQAEALAVDANIYAEQYGVTKEEALRRLRGMLEASDEAIAQANADGADLAGLYFDHSPTEFGIVVRSKKGGNGQSTINIPGRAGVSRGAEQRAARAAARAALRGRFAVSAADVELAETVLSRPQRFNVQRRGNARNSRAELASAATSPALQQVPGLQTAYVDDRTGEVVLIVDATDAAAASSAAGQALRVPFRVDLLPGGFKDVSLRGGLFTQIPTQRWCMTAFGARRTSDGKTGVLTSGHCATSSQISMFSSDGRSYPLTQAPPLNNTTTGDLMFLSGTPLGSGNFRFDGSGLFRTVTGFRARSSTNAGNGGYYTASTVSGTFVCHVGQETLGSTNIVQSCGEVISTQGDRATGATTGGNYVIVRNTQSGAGTIRTSGTGTLKCFQGDSGGPWFAGTVAFGVNSACGWEGGVTNGTALYAMYSSVSEFGLIGVSLLVP